MNSNCNGSGTEGNSVVSIVEHIRNSGKDPEVDNLGERIYPVHSTTLENNIIEVDLKDLEELAATFKSPHFVISDFQQAAGNRFVFDRMASQGFIQEVKDLRFHFANIPAGLIVAYERIQV